LSDLTLQGRVARNASDDIQIFAGDYWNKKVIDIRWYNDDKPTKKGIRMNVDEAKKVHSILTRILREVDIDVEMD
jgi:hypothetical protein